jgi:aspartyl-tRNA(Asn)/glutamyl-tRNA(Gln) amidotransferase subunit C
MPGHERQLDPPIAPALAEHGVGRPIDVCRRHHPDRGQWHGLNPIGSTVAPDPSAIIGRMAALSRSDVEHVAHLARLGLTEAELALLEGQLNHIVDQYAILSELPTDAIAPTAQTIELENILRDDVVVPSLPVADVLANAPARDGGFIVVPAILDER